MPFGRLTWERLAAAGHAYLARRWQRLLALRQRLRLSEDAIHIALAVAIGLVAGLTNFVFFGATELIKWLTLDRLGDLTEIAEGLGPWARLAGPALGGLVAGLALHWGLRVVGTQGSTNLLEVVVAGDGRLPFRTTAIKSLSSLIKIGRAHV